MNFCERKIKITFFDLIGGLNSNNPNKDKMNFSFEDSYNFNFDFSLHENGEYFQT
jgi:hypothetical protein